MEAKILEESAEFYRTLLDLLQGQDEEHVRWQGCFREGGKVNLDTLGSEVWLEQFRYAGHDLYWFAILTLAIITYFESCRSLLIGQYHESHILEPMPNHQSERRPCHSTMQTLRRLVYPTRFAEDNAI